MKTKTLKKLRNENLQKIEALQTTLIKLIIIVLILVPFVSINSYAQERVDTLTAVELTQLSFDELLRVKIKPATLIEIEGIKTPGTITTITKEDIQVTPYRTLLDLLEVYVPSGTFTNHWLGSRIGIRGVMSDQNNSYLLIVDGENMNLEVENGPVFEIQNKDLSDIEKIEITSGPGSVVHGPGAIGGVISITTKKAIENNEAKFEVKRDFTYRYTTVNGSYALKKKNIAAYMFASINKSEGIKNPEFYYIDRAYGYGYGYMSETWGNKGLGTPAPNFYADFDNRPQIKAQLNIELFKEFTLSARYTSFSFIKQQQQIFSLEGPAFPGIYGQQFVTTAKNTHSFSGKLRLLSSISYQSQSHGDIALYQRSSKPFDDITQRRESYSENKINIRSMLNWHPSKKINMAFGAEYNYWYYGPEWGKDKNSFVLSFPSPILFAVLDKSSGFYAQYNQNDIVTVIDETIDANQFSGFFEVNYQPTKKTTLLISGRFDKHNLAKLAFSPRLAIIQELNKNNYLKLIAQQSVRLPNFPELYAVHYEGGREPKPEKLTGLELIYTRIQNDNFTLNLTSFYQNIDQVAWIVGNKLGVIGNFKTAGVEAGASMQVSQLKLMLNYSYIRQLNWEPEIEADYYLSNIGEDSIDIPLPGAGESRINNFPVHQIKLVSTYEIGSPFMVHFDARFASSYQQNDMLDSFRYVHDQYGLENTKAEMEAIYADITSKGYGKASFTSNLSVSYTVPLKKVELVLSAYSMNILSVNHIRYVYQFWEYGNNRQYPRQVGFVNEPRTFGVKLNLNI